MSESRNHQGSHGSPNTIACPLTLGQQADRFKTDDGASIFCQHAWGHLGPSLNLSTREIQVVMQIFDDNTELAIASNLGISSSTVHTYTERLYRKLGVRDRVQLVVRVTREFLDLTSRQDQKLPPICPMLGTHDCPWHV